MADSECNLSLTDALTDNPAPEVEEKIKPDFIASLEAEPFDDLIGETVGKVDYVPLLDDEANSENPGSKSKPNAEPSHMECTTASDLVVVENGEHEVERAYTTELPALTGGEQKSLFEHAPVEMETELLMQQYVEPVHNLMEVKVNAAEKDLFASALSPFDEMEDHTLPLLQHLEPAVKEHAPAAMMPSPDALLSPMEAKHEATAPVVMLDTPSQKSPPPSPVGVKPEATVPVVMTDTPNQKSLLPPVAVNLEDTAPVVVTDIPNQKSPPPRPVGVKPEADAPSQKTPPQSPMAFKPEGTAPVAMMDAPSQKTPPLSPMAFKPEGTAPVAMMDAPSQKTPPLSPVAFKPEATAPVEVAGTPSQKTPPVSPVETKLDATAAVTVAEIPSQKAPLSPVEDEHDVTAAYWQEPNVEPTTNKAAITVADTMSLEAPLSPVKIKYDAVSLLQEPLMESTLNTENVSDAVAKQPDLEGSQWPVEEFSENITAVLSEEQPQQNTTAAENLAGNFEQVPPVSPKSPKMDNALYIAEKIQPEKEVPKLVGEMESKGTTLESAALLEKEEEGNIKLTEMQPTKPVQETVELSHGVSRLKQISNPTSVKHKKPVPTSSVSTLVAEQTCKSTNESVTIMTTTTTENIGAVGFIKQVPVELLTNASHQKFPDQIRYPLPMQEQSATPSGAVGGGGGGVVLSAMKTSKMKSGHKGRAKGISPVFPASFQEGEVEVLTETSKSEIVTVVLEKKHKKRKKRTQPRIIELPDESVDLRAQKVQQYLADLESPDFPIGGAGESMASFSATEMAEVQKMAKAEECQAKEPTQALQLEDTDPKSFMLGIPSNKPLPKQNTTLQEDATLLHGNKEFEEVVKAKKIEENIVSLLETCVPTEKDMKLTKIQGPVASLMEGTQIKTNTVESKGVKASQEIPPLKEACASSEEAVKLVEGKESTPVMAQQGDGWVPSDAHVNLKKEANVFLERDDHLKPVKSTLGVAQHNYCVQPNVHIGLKQEARGSSKSKEELKSVDIDKSSPGMALQVGGQVQLDTCTSLKKAASSVSKTEESFKPVDSKSTIVVAQQDNGSVQPDANTSERVEDLKSVDNQTTPLMAEQDDTVQPDASITLKQEASTLSETVEELKLTDKNTPRMADQDSSVQSDAHSSKKEKGKQLMQLKGYMRPTKSREISLQQTHAKFPVKDELKQSQQEDSKKILQGQKEAKPEEVPAEVLKGNDITAPPKKELPPSPEKKTKLSTATPSAKPTTAKGRPLSATTPKRPTSLSTPVKKTASPVTATVPGSTPKRPASSTVRQSTPTAKDSKPKGLEVKSPVKSPEKRTPVSKPAATTPTPKTSGSAGVKNSTSVSAAPRAAAAAGPTQKTTGTTTPKRPTSIKTELKPMETKKTPVKSPSAEAGRPKTAPVGAAKSNSTSAISNQGTQSTSSSLANRPRTTKPPVPKASAASPDSKKLAFVKTAPKMSVAPKQGRPASAPVPDLKNVKSKIGSTDNMKYQPGGGRAKPVEKKPDSSSVAARKTEPATVTKSAVTKTSAQKQTNGKVQIVSKKVNYSHVQSKCGSKDNIKHVPGGGNVQKPATTTSRTKSPGGSKQSTDAVQILNKKIDVSRVASKCGSKANIKHKPGGGEIKIENQKLNFKDKAQAKVGSLDNVGHAPGGGNIKTEGREEAGDGSQAPQNGDLMVPEAGTETQHNGIGETEPAGINQRVTQAFDTQIPETSI
ncbi:microtubule-associated protein 4 isoform X5 [Latimeria chalumnae]|uniref:microtubule-associated protein 4 isoform X5 n=1 Tax=Latimeria chalumnae TaxID=7897 RepID=UPI00313E93D1